MDASSQSPTESIAPPTTDGLTPEQVAALDAEYARYAGMTRVERLKYRASSTATLVKAGAIGLLASGGAAAEALDLSETTASITAIIPLYVQIMVLSLIIGLLGGLRVKM